MKTAQSQNNEKGFALILSLMVMAGMSVLAIAIFTTSTTDMYISRNEKEARTAFYLAETGIEEAVGRMDLSAVSNPTRFVGESSTEKQIRRTVANQSPPVAVTPAAVAGTGGYTGDFFASDDIITEAGMASLFGSYSVSVAYAVESGATWDNTNGFASEIVLYGNDFGFSGMGVPTIGINPVYQIDSDGKTPIGTEVSLRAYVTSSSLNVLPPGDTILFTEGTINVGGGGGLSGKVATVNVTGESPAVFGCSTTGGCFDVSPSVTGWTPGGMQTYLGMDINALVAYADSPSPYVQGGTNTVTYDPPATGDDSWGEVCNPGGAASNIPDHICDNEAKLIYINNAGAGAARIASNATGRGILVVTGDLDLAGGLVWEGMIYVMGNLAVNGTNAIWGTLMIEGDGVVAGGPNPPDVNIIGGLDILGSTDIASSVSDMVGIPKIVRWVRR